MDNAPIAATAGDLYKAIRAYLNRDGSKAPIYVAPGGGCLHDGKGHEVASLNCHVHLPANEY
jgi:transketolase